VNQFCWLDYYLGGRPKPSRLLDIFTLRELSTVTLVFITFWSRRMVQLCWQTFAAQFLMARQLLYLQQLGIQDLFHWQNDHWTRPKETTSLRLVPFCMRSASDIDSMPRKVTARYTNYFRNGSFQTQRDLWGVYGLWSRSAGEIGTAVLRKSNLIWVKDHIPVLFFPLLGANIANIYRCRFGVSKLLCQPVVNPISWIINRGAAGSGCNQNTEHQSLQSGGSLN
jgi:hypothetical protein